MKIHQLERKLWLPRPIDEVFQFFADAANLELLTPPWLNFRIDTPLPIAMRVGTRIDYRLRVHGFALRWQSEITAWEPQHRFVDEQRRGPYRLWHHEHLFEDLNGGTMTRDTVRYAVPFDLIAHRFFVRPDLKQIFDFRHRKMSEVFGVREMFEQEEVR